MQKMIKLFDPVIGREEELAVLKTLRSHFWASGAGGRNVLKFEQSFKEYVDTDSCVAVNNGTAALHLALSLFDIDKKEVILPSLSFVSTANAVIYNGGIPKFVEIDPCTMCLDTDSLEDSITTKTRIILPVHFAGMPCDLDRINKICKKNDCILIEDAAHAAGTTYKKRKIGTHGTAVCFSFHPVKNLAMPTGGAITLNSKKSQEHKKILKIRRWCGISNRKDLIYDINQLGWNFYMNEFSAAIGIEQLKKLDKLNKKRNQVAKRYSEELVLENKMKYDENCSYHFFWICVKNRNHFIKNMKEAGIETGIHYKPIHTMSLYKSYRTRLPITEKIGEEIVSIATHPNLTDDDVSKIIKSINKFSH